MNMKMVQSGEIYMGYEQIAWYEWNVKGIEKAAGRLIPSMTFSHFALPEMRQAVEKNGIYNESDKSYTISDAYGFGKCAYLPGVSPVNSGFFDQCLALGSTTHIFCGHDHENNASITHQDYDDVMADIYETSRQITGVRRPQRGIGQTLRAPLEETK